MFDFISIGEILIDFAPTGEENTFKANPGGAPANVACVLSKLGCNTAFVGKIGDDAFGRQCTYSLENINVNTDYLIMSEEAPTTLAFVCLDDNGNREFSFYRDNTADVSLTISDINKLIGVQSKYFHFGSVSLTKEPSKTAVLKAVENAKNSGAIISYDPNLRLALWKSKDEAKEVILGTLHFADIVKISEEEAEFLFGETDCAKVCDIIYKKYNTSVIILTRAAKGCNALINGKAYTSKAYNLITIDTTGAGDSFLAGMLYNLIQFNKNIENLTDQEIAYMLDFANATGSLVTTKKGAIPAIPTLNEIRECMRKEPRLII